jgi:hypothetical protein
MIVSSFRVGTSERQCSSRESRFLWDGPPDRASRDSANARDLIAILERNE